MTLAYNQHGYQFSGDGVSFGVDLPSGQSRTEAADELARQVARDAALLAQSGPLSIAFVDSATTVDEVPLVRPLTLAITTAQPIQGWAGESLGYLGVVATYQGGAPAPDVQVTAQFIKGAEDPSPNDVGPYFDPAFGASKRIASGLTNSAGALTFSDVMRADSHQGTFLLRVTAEGADPLDIELTVQ